MTIGLAEAQQALDRGDMASVFVFWNRYATSANPRRVDPHADDHWMGREKNNEPSPPAGFSPAAKTLNFASGPDSC